MLVARELGLEEGSLTGTWDFAHNLQIVWKNALAMHPVVEDLLKLMFDIMDDYRVGKAGTMFRQRAAELGNLVLSNKKRQTTRFVQSLVRGFQAYLRNLPTLLILMSENYEAAVLKKLKADAELIWNILYRVRDPPNLLLAVGLYQLLEKYIKNCVHLNLHQNKF